jgi:tRNA nucleotidyltransferase (CCA-adding enzyme)
MEPKENWILPPKTEAPPSPQLYATSEKYGVIESYTKPGFLENSEKFKDVYKMEVPEEVTDLCREIRGIGGTALLVGGSVRDMVINTEFERQDLSYKDLDLEIYGLSKETVRLVLLNLFGEENINDVGKSYGITKVKIKGFDEPLDISMPRRESKSGVTHKDFDVEADPSMSIHEASFRRDLSMNCLSFDPLTQTLYDPYNGVEDIRNRTINVIDEKTFMEDPLRVMRVMQFLSRFEFIPSDKTLKICKHMTNEGQLDNLSESRITGEFAKLLTKGIRPSIGLEFARETGILERYWPELNSLIGVKQPENYHPEGDVWNHTLQVVDAGCQIAQREKMDPDKKLTFMLACLCHDMGKPSTSKFENGKWTSWGHEEAGVEVTESFLDHFSLDIIKTGQRKMILLLVAEHLRPITLHTESLRGINMDKAVRRLSMRLAEGNTDLEMLVLVAEADQRGRNGDSTLPLKESDVDLEWKEWILEKAKDLEVINKPEIKTLSGNELMDLIDREQGPWIGAILKALEMDWAEGLPITKEGVLKHYNSMSNYVDSMVGDNKGNLKHKNKIWVDLSRLDDPRDLIYNEEIRV